MFYRTTITLAFKTKTNANRLKAACQPLLALARPINLGQLNQEKGFIMVEKCYHDEATPKPCEILYMVEPASLQG